MNEKFVRWVNNTLPMCKAQRLDRFRILFAIDKFVPHDIDKWLEFAFARKVQRLELNLRVGLDELYPDIDDCYAFPGQILLHNVCQPHLDNLPPLWHNFKNVKVLLLKAVNVSDKVLEFFLHNCPFLEETVVHGSDELVNLQVVGPSLKLKLLEVVFCSKLKSLQICDTNLVRLRTTSGHKLVLRNVPMLIEVDIAGSTLCTQMLDVISPWVSCFLSQLEVLKLFVRIGWEYLEHYSVPELPKLKKFVVSAFAWSDASVLGCTDAMRAAPHLEEFELKLIWTEPRRSQRECVQVVRCPHHHLKVLRLRGYYARISELELVRYFLENATALEKIIVDPRCQYVYLSPNQIQEGQITRNLAKLQLESEVPPHIELVIL